MKRDAVGGARVVDDAGVTMIEMLVVMVLLSIVGTIISATMINSMRNSRQLQSRSYSASTVQTQLERMARDIRVADPLRAVSPNSLTADVYRDNRCIRETWSIASGALIVTSITYSAWSACGAFPSAATPISTTTSTVLPALGNGTTPIFGFQSPSGTVLPAPQPREVATVTITLTQSQPEGRSGVSFTTAVGVRNATLR